MVVHSASVVLRGEGRMIASATVVRAVAEVVYPPGVTRADWAELLDVLRGIREDAADERAARRLEEQVPMFARLGPFIRSPQGLTFLITVVIALVGIARDQLADATQEPPSVVVEDNGPSPADVERIVEERLREFTESGGRLPNADAALLEDDVTVAE